jgi:hypothetical protein
VGNRRLAEAADTRGRLDPIRAERPEQIPTHGQALEVFRRSAPQLAVGPSSARSSAAIHLLSASTYAGLGSQLGIDSQLVTGDRLVVELTSRAKPFKERAEGIDQTVKTV